MSGRYLGKNGLGEEALYGLFIRKISWVVKVSGFFLFLLGLRLCLLLGRLSF